MASDRFGDSNTATVTVHPVNVLLVSNNLIFDMETNTTLNGTLNATDANKDSITYKLINNASNGNITVNPNGTFIYTPIDSFIGNDSFSYTSNDWNGTGNIATVNINVHPVNHAPIATDIEISVNKNEML